MDATTNPTAFAPTPQQRAELANGTIYEFFTREHEAGEEVLRPVRPNIVAEYSASGMGYLIQEVDGGFRWLCIEAGEDDEIGSVHGTRLEAVQSAVRDWREIGQGDSWAQWSKDMARAATVPERIEVSALAELISSEAGDELSAKTIFALSFKIAELVNNS